MLKWNFPEINLTEQNSKTVIEKAYIALGSNLGSRSENLREAIELLKRDESTIISGVSKIYLSEPKYFIEQPDFLNAVIKIKTSHSPLQLLNLLLKIETELGRIRTKKNGPRLIDMDILFYGDRIIKSDDLEIPHPMLYERLFVLKPLEDIDPKFVCPVTGKTISELVNSTNDKEKIELYEEEIIRLENTRV